MNKFKKDIFIYFFWCPDYFLSNPTRNHTWANHERHSRASWNISSRTTAPLETPKPVVYHLSRGPFSGTQHHAVPSLARFQWIRKVIMFPWCLSRAPLLMLFPCLLLNSTIFQKKLKNNICSTHTYTPQHVLFSNKRKQQQPTDNKTLNEKHGIIKLCRIATTRKRRGRTSFASRRWNNRYRYESLWTLISFGEKFPFTIR